MILETAVAAHSDPVLRYLAAAVALITATAPVINHLKGKRRDSGRRSEFAELQSSLKESHSETRMEIRELRETMTLRMDRIEAAADNAQVDATAALHASVGINGTNGNKGNIAAVEKRVDALESRERDRLSQTRPLGAFDPTYDRRS